MTNKVDRDMEELIPGNRIDHIYGADDPEIDNQDFIQCQEMINAELEQVYREDLRLFYPDDDQFYEHLAEVS